MFRAAIKIARKLRSILLDFEENRNEGERASLQHAEEISISVVEESRERFLNLVSLDGQTERKSMRARRRVARDY